MSYGQPQSAYAPPGQGNQPYAPPMSPPQQQEASGCSCLTLSLVGLGVIVLACCGMGGGGWFVWQNFTATLKAEVQKVPAVQEHIGEIEEFEVNFMEAGQIMEKEKDKPQNVQVYKVKGSKGSGTVVVRIVQAGKDIRIDDGELRMDSGETYELNPER